MSKTPKIDIRVPSEPFVSTWNLTKTLCMALFVVPLVYLVWVKPTGDESWFVITTTVYSILFMMNEFGYDIIRKAERTILLRLSKGCKDYNDINVKLERENQALADELVETYEEIDSLKVQVKRLTL